jgi:hypothetical protein
MGTDYVEDLCRKLTGMSNVECLMDCMGQDDDAALPEKNNALIVTEC